MNHAVRIFLFAAAFALSISLAASAQESRSQELRRRLDALKELIESQPQGLQRLQATGLSAHAEIALNTNQLDLCERKIAEAYRALGLAENRPERAPTPGPETEGESEPPDEPGGLPLPDSAVWSLEDSEDAIIGIQYALNNNPVHRMPGTARLFARSGASWIKFQNVFWKFIEPNAPRGEAHAYDFAVLDQMVKSWQEADAHIQMVLHCNAKWAVRGAQPPLSEFPEYRNGGLIIGNDAGSLPLEEYLDDYSAFVTAVVERYDHDGRDDMPGLKAPVLHYEISSEVQHIPFWCDGVDEYLKTLELSHKAAKEASPDVKIILSGMHFGNQLIGLHSLTELESRVNEIVRGKPEFQRYLAERIVQFVSGIFEATEYYDIVEFHSLASYHEIFDTVKFIENHLRRLGHDADIWVGDATSAPEIGIDVGVSSGELPWEASIPQRTEIRNVLQNPRHADYGETKTWYEREQVGMSIKKIVMTKASGAKRIFLCSLEDWGALSPYPFHGLADAYRTPRPVMGAMALLSKRFENCKDFARIENAGQGVYAFKFDSATGDHVIVAWLEDDLFSTMDSEQPTRQTSFPVSGNGATIERFYIDEGAPRSESLEIARGRVRVTLGKMPVMIHCEE
ncbi:MAG: hypothetical protein NUW37_08035 [Planctomycetes bacterium]|nr:hypothetical protein [Planctomycetota bacterium]